jgi:putrescine transport system ATP-binding protein
VSSLAVNGQRSTVNLRSVARLGSAAWGLLVSQPQSYIRIEHITKRFAEFTAVDDVSLEIERGEIFCLLGGSGCGKTTLLRMLAGFEQPSAGRILIDGADMAEVPPYERPINMMFQSYALFPHMSVEKNIAFGLEQERRPKDEIATRVGEILDIVKMKEFAKRKPHQLSGGQRQRVALARSLVKRPKLLLLDEPLGALDRKLREHTQFELLNIQHRLGVTFIVVTHDQEEAMTLATRIGVMDRGRIVQVGTPREVYEAPATRFVADFIGTVNLFEGHVLANEPQGTRIQCAQLGAPVVVDRVFDVSPGGAVWVALRPEKIALAREESVRAENAALGTVSEIAYMGDASVYLVRLTSGVDVKITQPNTMRVAEERFARGDRVALSWNAASPIVGDE